MSKITSTLAKIVTPEEQSLKDTLSSNVRKYRRRRNWSQFTLAAKTGISTNFLADIEAGNTWVSAQTLVKFAQTFEIEAFELLRPDNIDTNNQTNENIDETKQVLTQFSQNLTAVLEESINKALEHVKKQYEIS